MTETFWQSKIYNWRHNHWNWQPDAGDAVMFEPFQSHSPVYGECRAVYGNYAVITVPRGNHAWFNVEAGEYIVPEKLLFPQ